MAAMVTNTCSGRRPPVLPVRRLVLLLAITVTVVMRDGVAAAKYISPYCPDTRNCSCNFVMSDLEIDCPPIEPLISVIVKSKDHVQVDCTRYTDNVFGQLPPMRLGNSSWVRIQKCPTPVGGTPYNAILDRIGLQQTRNLILSDCGSTLVRQHLTDLPELRRLIIQKHLTGLPGDLFAELGNLTWLELRYTPLHLTEDTMRDLHNLETLEMSYIELRSLVPGVFRNQRKLRQLLLWGNSLTNLTQAELEGLTAVESLDLSGNNLQGLAQGVFDHMISLSDLNLGTNPLESLPDGLLTHTNLSRFALTDNKVPMTTLPAGLLANLTRLDEVRLTSGLLELSEDVFAGSVNIKNITLANNQLSTVPRSVFAGLTNLVDLDLRGNLLSHLEDGTFESLESLVVLELSNNQLTNISNDLLIGLRSLQLLQLGGNQLVNIGENAFRETTALLNLQLPDNQLSFITYTDEDRMLDPIGGSPFVHLTKLRTLNLRNNQLVSMLPDWSIHNRDLELLDLSYNRIDTFGTGQLQSWALDGSTVVTNLTHNAIERIDLAMLDQQTQRNITFNVYVDHNPLVCDCQLITFVQYLQSKTPPSDASARYALHFFVDNLSCAGPAPMLGRHVASVRDNELLCPLGTFEAPDAQCPSQCECTVRPVDLALIVNCSNAGLTHVPHNLPIPTKFRLNFTELHVENNHIVVLPHAAGAFANRTATGYDYVTEIHASRNNITHLHAGNIPPLLRVLNVRYNHLRTINQSVLTQFNRTRRLQRISLGYNPWQCDCSAKALLLFSQNHGHRLADLEAVHCADGTQLQENRLGDICPEDHTMVALASAAVMLLGLTIGVLVAFYYKYEQEVKVWLFAHNLLACLVTEQEVDSDKKYDAFVSYSHADQDFVSECIVRELEKGEQPYKLCIHERDWLVGGAITQSIADSVESSRRTIIVLTKNFVESDWGKMEFRVAHKKALSENRARVIVVVCGELQDMKLDTLDAEMRAYLQTNTYIKWGDPWFWKKLRYAMPHLNQAGNRHQHQQHHQHHNSSTVDMLHRMKALKGSVDDQLDLIKPQAPPTPPMTTPPAELAGQKFANSLNGPLMLNGHVNGAFIINTNAKQSDV